MQDSSFHCLCEVCVFFRKDGNSYVSEWTYLALTFHLRVQLLPHPPLVHKQGEMKCMTSPLVQRLLGRRLTLDSRKHTQVLDEMNCDAGREIQLESTASMNDLMKALVDGMSHLCPLEDSCKKASCISQVQPVRGLICPESP